MTIERNFDNLRASEDFAEVFRMLQDGEKTASDMEKKLKAVEKHLDYLLTQFRENKRINQDQIVNSSNTNSMIKE
ncbi:hypothetical protein RI543_003993 [Arxiozyma heterogenica]|uniref:Uncharacterized protein n=2 Tax=Arxiozyma heterogenica TaxID=278026 RepID=A0AAN7WM02_9SACH|nr:hypothetical protein RI543_003993 [Kazachstania heterogenica]